MIEVRIMAGGAIIDSRAFEDIKDAQRFADLIISSGYEAEIVE